MTLAHLREKSENWPVVALTTPGRSIAYSETFIRAHIEHLDGDVHVLYNGYPPTLYDEGRSIVPLMNAKRKIFRSLAYRLGLVRNENDILKYFTRRLLRELGVQVVMAEYGPTGASLLEICAAADLPLIVHFHGYDAYKKDILAEYADRYSTMFQFASYVVGVSRDMCNKLVELGAPKEKIVHIPCGANPDYFFYASVAGRPPVILTVGRFVEKKAPHLLLLVLERVLRECPDAELWMVGDGPLLGTCKQLARHYGIAGNVRFLGAVPQSEIASMMNRSKLFAQHSVVALNGDSEGTPVAVMEAGLSGLPVVATAHKGIADVVVDGETGLLVPEEDVSGMAEKILWVLGDDDVAVEMGRAAHHRINEHFSLTVTVQKLNAIIRSAALGESSPFSDDW